MTFQKPLDSQIINQIFPEKKQVSLEGLYLDQRLAEMSVKMGRALVVTDFLTDRNGVIAKANDQHDFRVPLTLRNKSDWRLFQELLVQADVIISSEAYFKRLVDPSSHVEDVLSQFEPGQEFEELGEWRLKAGYRNRSPDLAVVSRSLDFEVPEIMFGSGRLITVFTINSLARSNKAKALISSGVIVFGSGDAGVEGKRMLDGLSYGMDYRVIMMATGPAVLQLLLEAGRPDLFYVTEAQLEIPFDDPASVRRILPEGKKVSQLKEYNLTHQFIQENVVTENGSQISQLFLRYDRKSRLAGH